MTAEQAKIVTDTWQRISSKRQLFAQKFYGLLFRRSPHLQHLFADDIGEQVEKFTAMIDAIVGRLKDGHELDAELRALGKRHDGYGVEAKDYTLVAEAFIGTLERCLGTDFTAKVQDAWASAYQLIANEMLRGAKR